MSATHWTRRIALIGPLAAFLAFVILVYVQLGRPTQVVVTSKLIGKPMPMLDLKGLDAQTTGLSNQDMRGHPALINVFASWCLPCQAEAAQLAQIAKMGVPINAIAVRDAPGDVTDFLAKYGNPFKRIGLDPDGRTQIELGSSGVPETFVIDAKGYIRYQHIGEIRAEDIPKLMRAYADAGA